MVASSDFCCCFLPNLADIGIIWGIFKNHDDIEIQFGVLNISQVVLMCSKICAHCLQLKLNLRLIIPKSLEKGW